MRSTSLALTMLLAALAAGCGEGQPGGPGVTQTPKQPPAATPPTTGTETDKPSTVTTNKPIVGEAERTFRLDTPNLTTRLKQGEMKEIKISLNRGANFDEDVTLELSGMPQGVTADPARAMIKHGENDATFKIQAADDAALGDFTIHVVGHPATGADAKSEFQLSVSEK